MTCPFCPPIHTPVASPPVQFGEPVPIRMTDGLPSPSPDVLIDPSAKRIPAQKSLVPMELAVIAIEWPVPEVLTIKVPPPPVLKPMPPGPLPTMLFVAMILLFAVKVALSRIPLLPPIPPWQFVKTMGPFPIKAPI